MEERKAVTITIPEGITERPWWSSEMTVKLWLVLLMEGQGKGEVRISLRNLASTAGLTLQNVRTCMGKLKSAGDIEVTQEPTHDSTHRINLIKLFVPKVSSIEEKEEQHADQHTAQHTEKTAKKGTTRAEKEERMKARMTDFYNSLVPYVATYGKQMVREFFDYWSEPNKSKSAMRFESEKTWDLVRRLDYWQRRSSSYSGGRKTAKTEDPLGRYKEGLERINQMFSDGNEQQQQRQERTETWGFFDGPDEQ